MPQFGGYQVRLDCLAQSADRARRIGEQLDEHVGRDRPMNPSAVGDGELAAAIQRLQDESRRAVDLISRTALESQSRLRDTDEAYAEMESGAGSAFDQDRRSR